ncbi:RecA-like recombination protein [Proteus phage vB_PmiM_Pm5461]|uniref:RecA-like recombination protein n=1 Tax=Proteus phage vB_PmiM_Pm5461 TaxID=1636250 RepID=A0A0G2SSU6_9CAUD|nr:DNA repair protein [Proteus phage vB_PmiM_Pm5461]AKA61895.1 RecA-like recombination protein [Proteus phage vB_PmiM_Pm5461]
MSDLKKRLMKASTNKMTSVLSESKFFNEKSVVRTKIPTLNIALSGIINGGLQSGITILAGPSKHFKSNMGLTLVAAYMNAYPDAICLFYDSEFGITSAYLRSMGVDPDRVVHTPVKNVEELKIDMINQLEAIERGEKVIVFIDSIGNLASKKEVEDALNEKSVADMTRAKQLKSLFRMATPYFTLKDIPCVGINHTIETIEMFSKTVMTGGCVVAGTKIKMADGSTKNVEDIKPGDRVKTLVGDNEVTYIWDPETLAEGTPECIEIEFEDGYKVTVSDTHKFLVMVKDIPTWVEAKDLLVGMDCAIK